MASKSWSRYLTVSAGDLRNWKDVEKVMENLNREIERIQGGSLTGLIKAAMLIRNETEHGAVKTPVDLGNLRASWFVVSSGGKVLKGGGKSHTSEGQSAKFVGPKAGDLVSGHSSMLMEMQGQAETLANVMYGPFLIMGYTANYALWIHENIGAHFKRPGAGPKWFEAAIKSQRDNIIKVIKENAKVKR